MKFVRPKKSGLYLPRRQLLVSAASAAALTALPREAFAAATTWSTTDKSANFALSNGNRTATVTSATLGGIRSSTGCSTGKVFFEISIGTVASAAHDNFALGLSPSSYVFTNVNGLGDTGTIGIYALSAQEIYDNTTEVSFGSNPDAAGDILGFAVNFTTKLVWITSPVMVAAGTPWNNSSTANPATGVGGHDISAVISAATGGVLYVTYVDDTSTESITANFGASAFNHTVPAGFVSWDVQVNGGTLARSRPRLSLVAAMGPQSIAAKGAQGLHAESAEGTTVTTAGPLIWDSLGNNYTLTSGGQIQTNGALDHDPGAGVIELYYHNHQVYQENSVQQWYTRTAPNLNWSGPVASPISTITPLFWDDFSEGTMDWTTRWYGYPPGSASSYIDQSDPTLQADARSVRIIQNGGNYYMINSTFPFPADATALRTRFGANGYCAAEILSKKVFPPSFYAVGRCKQPISNGVMGAFWFFRQAGFTHDQFEELDLTENPGGQPRPVSMTIHYGPNTPGTAQGYYDYWTAAQDGTHWHTYACEFDAYPGNVTFYLDGSVLGVHATAVSMADSMNMWLSIYQSPGSNAWFGNTDSSTIFPSQSIYDWVGVFNNKTEADSYLAANPQFSTATGGTDGPLTTGQL